MLKFRNKDGDIVMEESSDSGNLTVFDKKLKEEFKKTLPEDIVEDVLVDKEDETKE